MGMAKFESMCISIYAMFNMAKGSKGTTRKTDLVVQVFDRETGLMIKEFDSRKRRKRKVSEIF